MENKYSFPLCLKNNRTKWQKIGGTWFPPNKTVCISTLQFEEAKQDFVWAIEEAKRLSVEVQRKEEKAKPKRPQVQAEKPQKPTKVQVDIEAETLINDFAEKKIHWKVLQKELMNIHNKDVMEKLLMDANTHNLPTDGAVYKSVRKRLEELSI